MIDESLITPISINDRHLLTLSIIVLLAGFFADIITTIVGLNMGFAEINPLAVMSISVFGILNGLLLIKIIMIVILCLLYAYLNRKGERRFVAWMIMVVGIIWLLPALSNLRFILMGV